MNTRLRSFIKLIIGWPLTSIAFVFILKFILPNTAAVAVSVRSLNIWLLTLGIICFILYFFVRSYFWQKLLHEENHKVSLKETTWKWGISELRRYIPGNIWSLVGRTSSFSENNITKKDIISYAIIEAEFIVVGSIFLSLLCLNFIVYGLLSHWAFKSLIIMLINLVAIGLILLFLINQYLLRKFQSNTIFKNFKLNILPKFSFQTNLILFFLQTTALFFFGLGTYFSISSLTLLYPQYILTLIGFFVFSLLVGYVSFITPMGLGIREGIMTAGLTKFIPLSLAGFSALFTRIIFIISELLFLLLSFYWFKTKNKVFLTIEKISKNNWHVIVLSVFILLYIIYMTSASFLRYDNFYTGRFDLGNMDQTVWNTLHGRIFQQTDPNGTNIISRLAFHADFILVLLAPFYLLWQDPKMLLLIQTVFLACGAIFIYLITKKVLKNNTFSLVFSSLYLINSSMNYTNLYDFHGVTLATTFLLGAWYFLSRKKYVWYILFLLLAGITKEQVWIITGMFGAYTLTKKNSFERWMGATILLVSLAVFYFLIEYAIPQTRGGAHFALAYYSDFGSSPSEILKTLILNPKKTILTILQPDQVSYVLKIFAPLGFVSIFSPLFLLFSLPDFAGDLLSNNSQLHEIYYQYTSTITPFIFLAAIYGVNNIIKRFPSFKTYLIYYVLLAALLSAYFFGPLPGSINPNVTMFDSPQPYKNIINNFLSDIPRRYSIAATNNLGSHLSHRQRIFTIPVGIDKADIIAFLLNDPYAQPSLEAQKKMAENMKKDKNYIEIFKQGDFIVFEKRNLYIKKEPNITHVKLFPLSIPALQHRDYIGGEIKIEKKLEDKKSAARYLISFPSDGLKLYALLDIPTIPMPVKGFPVIVINTVSSYENIADYFTQQGFLVIKPDYRGKGYSEVDNTTLAPLAYSVDTLNIISSLDSLHEANPHSIFLWGNDVGGGVVLKVLETVGDNQDTTIKEQIKGAVTWAPITTSYQNQIIYTDLSKSFGSPQTNPIFWQSISPLNYIDDIKTPLEIDHGTSDTVIPYTSSIELYNDLVSFNKNAKLNLFPNDNHDLSKYEKQVLKGNIEFFRKLL